MFQSSLKIGQKILKKLFQICFNQVQQTTLLLQQNKSIRVGSQKPCFSIYSFWFTRVLFQHIQNITKTTYSTQLQFYDKIIKMRLTQNKIYPKQPQKILPQQFTQAQNKSQNQRNQQKLTLQKPEIQLSKYIKYCTGQTNEQEKIFFICSCPGTVSIISTTSELFNALKKFINQNKSPMLHMGPC
eukprot:TRINITY_DN6600_c0_g3_i2.p1 TRINITY_DN6600_c0_g3~~TRINITY_DN6600_c0_g3_i2.p1  ORF type:complete len:185 (-),score=-19.59 TRINITY_DN6600_c0_g3_i2:351-905(-)